MFLHAVCISLHVFSLLRNIFCFVLDVLSSSRSQSWILHSCLFVLHFAHRYFHGWSQYLYKLVFLFAFLCFCYVPISFTVQMHQNNERAAFEGQWHVLQYAILTRNEFTASNTVNANWSLGTHKNKYMIIFDRCEARYVWSAERDLSNEFSKFRLILTSTMWFARVYLLKWLVPMTWLNSSKKIQHLLYKCIEMT